jgi:hypothetical protein
MGTRATHRRFTMCPDLTGEVAVGSQSDFDGAVEAYRQALVPFLNGDPKPAMEFFWS